jgi:hypothetical protein
LGDGERDVVGVVVLAPVVLAQDDPDTVTRLSVKITVANKLKTSLRNLSMARCVSKKVVG